MPPSAAGLPVSEFDLEDDPTAAAVLLVLTRDRLLTRDEEQVEIAHEALIREWPRLRGWLQEDTAGRQLRRHITQSARQWAERGRDPADLYQGARLSAALDWWRSDDRPSTCWNGNSWPRAAPPASSSSSSSAGRTAGCGRS